jgi:hypothetical protein
MVSFGMSSEALGNERRASTPDAPNAPDPHSENNSAANEHHRRKTYRKATVGRKRVK